MYFKFTAVVLVNQQKLQLKLFSQHVLKLIGISQIYLLISPPVCLQNSLVFPHQINVSTFKSQPLVQTICKANILHNPKGESNLISSHSQRFPCLLFNLIIFLLPLRGTSSQYWVIAECRPLAPYNKLITRAGETSGQYLLPRYSLSFHFHMDMVSHFEHFGKFTQN